MKIYLIRHGKTYGNTLGRYIGKTDESLCDQGIRELEKKKKLTVQRVYTSPLRRCIETADILIPDSIPEIRQELSECDFGKFENKSYRDLDGDRDYQSWIDSGGTGRFPGGESQLSFRERCTTGFTEAVDEIISRKIQTAAFVVHGGTIMAILDRFSKPHQDFFSWQVKNGEGYLTEIDPVLWKLGKREVRVRGDWESE